jgi:carboxymethylenebutenolidase
VYEAQLAETIRYSGHNGDEIDAYYARPLGPGPYPSVLVLHHMPGWDEATKEITRNFAHHGYAAIAPHLFTREAVGTAKPEDATAIVRAAGGLSDEQFLGDAAGAISYLRAQLYTSDRVGVIGYCSGGRQAFMAGCRLPVEAVVNCYGSRVVPKPEELTPNQPVAVIDMTPELACPMLMLSGEEDQNPSPEHIKLTTEALLANHKDFDAHAYANAGHGFFSVDRPSYRVEAAQDGWQRVFAFFGTHLQGG